MKKQGGGAIVNVTSISRPQGLPGAHAYTAAEGGAINLTRSIAITYGADNIRCNAIAPGFIATPMKRPGASEEMASACLYLGLEESTYCQGAALVVDGGTTARQ